MVIEKSVMDLFVKRSPMTILLRLLFAESICFTFATDSSKVVVIFHVISMLLLYGVEDGLSCFTPKRARAQPGQVKKGYYFLGSEIKLTLSLSYLNSMDDS